MRVGRCQYTCVVTTLRNLVTRYSSLQEADIEWLERLMLDLPLIADLALSDAVLWVPTDDHGYLAVAHARPAGSVTIFYRDIIGDVLRDDWRGMVDEAMRTGERVYSNSPFWYEESPMRLVAHAVRRRDERGVVHGP